MQTETTAPFADEVIDTNAEFINERLVPEQPRVLSSIMRHIFVETPRDFFGGIAGFFRRNYRHFADSLIFLKRPSLKIDPFSHKDYKEDCQQTFGLTIIFTLALIFMVKMDWIPVNQHMMTAYQNDVVQMVFELMIFVIFALGYLVLITLSVLCGRLLRKLFALPISRGESDILFAYLNNSLFSLTTIVAFLFRCGMTYDPDNAADADKVLGIFALYLLAFPAAILYWANRFAKFNAQPGKSTLGFKVTASILLSVLYVYGSFIITQWILSV